MTDGPADTASRVRVTSVEVLSDNWYVLKKTTFDYLRRDGTWQQQSRETYDRGNGAVILLYNRARGTVVLVRQFRFPAFVNGHHGLLIEAPAGLLDQESPEARIRSEAEEETGYRVETVERIFQAFMSPGSVTEILHFFVAEYDPASKAHAGGGVEDEGEDIEVLELPLGTALAMFQNGEIAEGAPLPRRALPHAGRGGGGLSQVQRCVAAPSASFGATQSPAVPSVRCSFFQKGARVLR